MGRRSLYFMLPVIAAVAAAGAAWTLMAREHPPGDPADAEQVAVGAALYGWNCARCHGEDLSGELGWVKVQTGLSEEEIERVAERLGDVAPAHDDSGSTSRLDDAKLYDVIALGPEKAMNKADSRMEGFEGRLDEDEIWAIVAFMKSTWSEAEQPTAE